MSGQLKSARSDEFLLLLQVRCDEEVFCITDEDVSGLESADMDVQAQRHEPHRQHLLEGLVKFLACWQSLFGWSEMS